MSRKNRSRRLELQHAVIPLVIAFSTFAAFLPALQNQFVSWDDAENFLDNPHYRGLGWTHLRWMWTTHLGHYIPLTWMTLGVQEKIGQMIPHGIHAPEQVVQAEGHPGQRNVVAQVRRPHPAEVGPPEPSIVRVVEEIVLIVPVHKLVLERWQEGGEGEKGNQQWRKPADPSLGRSKAHRATAPRTRAHGGRDLELARLSLRAHWSGANTSWCVPRWTPRGR